MVYQLEVTPYERNYHNNFYRPLNPPILGDFQAIGSPQTWGARGAKHT